MAVQVEALEIVRLQLEENVTKLQGLRRHWQTWEAEYESLKEALADLEPTSTGQELKVAATEAEGELLTPQEIKGLLESNGHQRSPEQILGLVSRRIDYVHENVRAAEKKLAVEQDKLDRVNFVGARDEGGLPITEITEELDEDGNVISANVSKPSDAAPKILDALRQSGITEDGREDEKASRLSSHKDKNNSISRKEEADNQSTTSGQEKTASKKKSVSFAESLDIQEAPDNTQNATVNDGDNTIEKPAHHQLHPSVARIPNESPADAVLRREMLQYNMEEVGAVVVEMDLNDEPDNESADDDNDIDEEELDDDDESDPDDDFDELDDDDEDEDAYGRTTRQVVTEDYRTKMQELERKLNARSMVNAGPEQPNPSSYTAGSMENEPKDTTTDKQPKSKAQKGVRFEENLDVQEAPQSTIGEPHPVPADTEVTERPVATEIVERKDNDPQTSANIPAPKKISKFKADRMNKAKSQPDLPSSKRFFNGPWAAGLIPATQMASKKFHTIPSDDTLDDRSPKALRDQTHVDTLVERPFVQNNTRAKEPDGLDPVMVNRQVSAEHIRAQNRMIQKEDGFMKIDQEELKDEGQPKMSRFKAARLARRS